MSLSFASWRRIWLLALVALAASACRAEFDVLVTVNPDGSGVVSTTTGFDDDVAEGLLDLGVDATGVVLDDLAQSGWVIVPPERRPDGTTVITATKEFGTTAQFTEVMEDLTGADGIFQDLELRRTKSFARVGYDLTGTIDTTVDLDSFADEDLEAALGRTITEVAADYEASEEQIDIRLQAELPGGLQGDAPDGIVDSEPNRVRAEWTASLADDEITSIALSSATREVAPLVLRGVAGLAAVLAGLVIFAQVLRVVLPDRRRRQGRRAKPKPKPKPPPKVKVVADDSPTPSEEPELEPEPAPTTDGDDNPHRILAIDAMGVLYREADDVKTLLIPFVRERSTLALTDEELAAKARLLSLGRITTGQFWASVGVPGEPAEIDASYLSRYQLMPGVIKYLRSARTRQMKVACVTNNAAAWSQALKTRHNLEGLIQYWVVSGSVGVRKPDKPIFEVLRRVTGQPPARILVVDDNLNILDAAHELGFATAWFSPDGRSEQAGAHHHIRNFEQAIDDPAEAGVARRAEATTQPND